MPGDPDQHLWQGVVNKNVPNDQTERRKHGSAFGQITMK